MSAEGSPVKAQPYVVMVKPVGSLCNMNCAFCYYLNSSERDPSLRGGTMSSSTLERFIQQYIESSPGPVVSFTWHGGEPTLAGLDFFRQAVSIQKKHLPEDWICWNNLQTNGLMLDDPWCAFLAQENFDIGLSIDGTPEIHDKYRRTRSGAASFQDAAAAVRLLQTHGIQPDLLCTVTSDAARRPLDVYQSLRSFNTGWIQFIPIVKYAEGRPSPESVSAEEYGYFLTEIFDQWVLHDLGRLEVQIIAETLRVWGGGQASLCWMMPTCGRALIVEHEGGVYSCDHYVDAPHRLGSLDQTPLGLLADSPEQLRFGQDKRDSLPPQCLACPHLEVCNGGCPKDRLPLPQGQGMLNVLCQGYQKFFSHIEPAARLVNSMNRAGHRPQAIMTELRKRLAPLWEGVGRNDPCPCKSGRKAKQCCWHKRVIL